MYYFYLDKVLLPIPPQKVTTKIKNQNKTINLINEAEVNMLKNAGLTEIEFDISLPNVKYPYARYNNGFQNAITFLDKFEKLKSEKKPFQFIVSRTMPNGKVLFDTNIKVSLEDYTIKEDKKEGFDFVVTIKLKQYKEFGTKICKINKESNGSSTAIIENKDSRETVNSPAPTNQNKTHTVISGDCLWNIAKKYYGDGSKYNKIFEANKDKIKNANLIYPGQVLVIPV